MSTTERAGVGFGGHENENGAKGEVAIEANFDSNIVTAGTDVNSGDAKGLDHGGGESSKSEESQEKTGLLDIGEGSGFGAGAAANLIVDGEEANASSKAKYGVDKNNPSKPTEVERSNASDLSNHVGSQLKPHVIETSTTSVGVVTPSEIDIDEDSSPIKSYFHPESNLPLPIPSPNMAELLATSPAKSSRKTLNLVSFPTTSSVKQYSSSPQHAPVPSGQNDSNDLHPSLSTLTGSTKTMTPSPLAVPTLPTLLYNAEGNNENDDSDIEDEYLGVILDHVDHDNGGGGRDKFDEPNITQPIQLMPVFHSELNGEGIQNPITSNNDMGIITIPEGLSSNNPSKTAPIRASYSTDSSTILKNLSKTFDEDDEELDPTTQFTKTPNEGDQIHKNQEENLDDEHDRLSPLARMRMDSETYFKRHVSAYNSLGNTKASHVPPMQQSSQQQQQQTFSRADSRDKKQPKHNRRERSVTLGSENSIEDAYGGFSIAKALSYSESPKTTFKRKLSMQKQTQPQQNANHRIRQATPPSDTTESKENKDSKSPGLFSSLSTPIPFKKITLSMLQFSDSDTGANEAGFSGNEVDNSGITARKEPLQGGNATETELQSKQVNDSNPLSNVPTSDALSKPIPLQHMESIASPPSVSSVSSLEEEELDRLASELSRPRAKSKRDRAIFRSYQRGKSGGSAVKRRRRSHRVLDGTNDGDVTGDDLEEGEEGDVESGKENEDISSSAAKLKRDREKSFQLRSTLKHKNRRYVASDDISNYTSDGNDIETGSAHLRSLSRDQLTSDGETTVNTLKPPKSYDTLDAHYNRRGFRARVLGQASFETSDSTQFTDILSIFDNIFDWDWLALMYLSIFSAVGVTMRAFVSRLFGGDCDDPTPTEDWLYPISKHICITASGRTQQYGGALFLDMPGNMMGSFIMGVMTGMSPEWPAIPWLPHDHPLQSEHDLHVGIKTALCGTLTTFSSWNSQMVLMMDGTANPYLGPQVGAALFGYLLGFQAAATSFRAGRTVAAWLIFKHSPHVFESEGSRMVRTRRGRRQLQRRIRRQMARNQSDGESGDNQKPMPIIVLPSMTKQKAYFQQYFWNVRVIPAIIIAVLEALYLLGDFYWGIPFYREMWIACLVAPIGTVVRWKLSKFNGTLKSPNLKWVPIGTFLANFLGTIVSALMTACTVHFPTERTVSDWEMSFYLAISLGFSGSLSTVSTFVKEIVDMGDKNPYFDKKSFLYLHGTLLSCCFVAFLVYSPLVRSG